MRTLGPGETATAKETAVTVKNTTARILHVAIGGGAFATIPPTVEGASITLAMLATEKTRWDKALATTIVAAWVEAGGLTVEAPPAPPPEGP